MPLPSSSLHRGDRSPAVAALHRTLELLDYKIDPAERDRRSYGTATEAVVREYQSHSSLPVTGVFDDATRASIENKLRGNAPYSVHGKVTDAGGRLVVGAAITAVDVDLRHSEPLGQATTDCDGEYEIRYSSNKFTRAEKDSADLVVRARIGDRVIAESATRFNAPEDVQIDLVSVERTGPSEYEQLKAAVDPLLDGTALTDLAESDVTFLAGETGLAADLWLAFVRAQHLAATAGAASPPRPAAPAASHDRNPPPSPPTPPGIPATAFYGWLRRGLPADWDGLRTTRVSVLRSALVEAVARHFIPALSDAQITQLLEGFPNTEHTELGDLVTATLPGPIATRLLGAVDAVDAVSDPLLASLVEAKTLEHGEAELVGLSVSVHRLAGPQPAVVAAILGAAFPSLPTGKLQRSRDLAALSTADWERALETARAPLPDGVPRAAQARGVAIAASAAFPEDAFRRQAATAPPGLSDLATRLATVASANPAVLTRASDALDLSHVPEAERTAVRDAHAALRSFANLHPGLGLHDVFERHAGADAARIAAARIANVAAVFEQNPEVRFVDLDYLGTSAGLAQVDFGTLSGDDRAQVIANLRAHQRIHAVTGNAVPAQEVLQSGLGSASAIAVMPAIRFAQVVSLPIAEAATYHAAAVELANDAALAWFSLFDHARDRATAPVRVIPSREQFFRPLEGYAKLLTDQPWCACEHCQSVLSPAAYFVDLMHYVEQNILGDSFAGRETHPLNLERRRPDLWDLELSCANTTDPVPTLDLVNEILERYLRDTVSFSDAAALYKQLAGEVRSFGQPFTLPLVRLTTLLTHFAITRYDIAHAMRVGTGPQARAWLGLSLRDYDLITITRFDAAFLLALFKISSTVTAPEPALAPVEMAALVRSIGLAHDTVEAVLHTGFVNVDGSSMPPIAIALGKRDPSDVHNNTEMVSQLTLRRLDRIHRFVRLWRALSWTVDELDYVLARLADTDVAMIVPESSDGEGTLERILHLLEVNAPWSLPVDELMALTDAFPTRAFGDAPALFDRLFNPHAFAARDGGWGPDLAIRFTHPSWQSEVVGGRPPTPVGHAIPSDNTLARLLAGLQLGDAELVALVAALRPHPELSYQPALEGSPESIALTRGSLSALYRHAKLRRLLGCSMTDFIQILALAPFATRSGPIGFIDSLADVRCAAEFFAWQKTSGFSLEQIRDLIDPAMRTPMPGDPDPAALAAEIIASAKADHSLEFADTLFTQLGLTEAQSRALVAANLGQAPGDALPFERRADLVRIRAIGLAGLVIPPPPATRVDAAAVTALLDRLTALHVLDVALGSALGRPLDEIAVLRSVADPPAQLDVAAIVRAIQGSAADAARLVALITRMFRFHALFRDRVFDRAGLAFVAASPAVLFGATATAPLTASPRITLGALRCVTAYVALAAPRDTGFTTASTPTDAAVIQRVVVDPFGASNADLAATLGTDPARISTLRTILSLPTDGFEVVAALARCLALADRLGVSSDTLARIVDESDLDTAFYQLARAAEDVFGAFRAKYPDERVFADKIEPFDDKLRARKRDGLVDYLTTCLATPFTDPNKLYEYFLIDVMMEGCARTSRVVAATSSLQLYVHRVLMNLERSANWDPLDPTHAGVRACFTSAAARNEWQWRQHYRVWEANRRVFLYPENYLEPELRDDKTPLFENLEDTLLQQDIDQASVHDAYSRYLTGFDELARLKIAGAYCDPNTAKLHLFGVTQDDAPVYYYREVDDSAASQAATPAPQFSAWHKLELQIPVRAVSPIVLEGRLYLFWIETTTRPVNSFNGGTAEFSGYRHALRVKCSMLRPDGVWSSPQLVRFYEGGGTADARIVEDPRDDSVLNDHKARLAAKQQLVGGATSAVTSATEPANQAAHDASDAIRARIAAQQRLESPPTAVELAVITGAQLFGVPFQASLDALRVAEGIALGVALVIEGQKIEASRLAADKLRAAQADLDALNRDIADLQALIAADVTIVRWDASRRNHRDALDNYKPESWRWDRVYPDVLSPGRADEHLRISVVPKGDEPPSDSPDPDDFEPATITLNELSPPESRRFNADTALNWSNGRLQTGLQAIFARRGQDFLAHTAWLNLPDRKGNAVAFAPPTSEVQIVNGLSSSVILETRGDAVWMRSLAATSSYAGTRLGTSLTRALSRQFWHDGADSLLDPVFQQGLAETRSAISPIAGQSEPARANPFHPDNACLTYFRETFFHIPFLVANHLNSQNRFADTQRWYHYIFHPTAEQGEPWRYREFREPAPHSTTLRALLTDDKAIAAYRSHPFSPHAIARTRMTAYQKAIVMKYVDNLLDWGDSLFNQFTTESINEATMLYVMAQDILGPRPPVLGSCGDGNATPRTYRTIRPGLGDVNDFLVELETPPAVRALPVGGGGSKLVVPASTLLAGLAAAVGAPGTAALTPSAPGPSAVGTPVVVRANQASAGTIWTRNSGTPLAALRGAQLAASFGASAVAPHDGTVTITGVLASGAIPGTGEPVGVAGGKTIVPFAATEPSPQEVTFSPQDAYQPGGFGLQDAILPRYLYSPAAIVPPKQAVFCIPPNEDLLACWSRVEDRLFKIRNCMDITGANRKPALFAPEIDPRLLVRMTAAGLSIDDVLNSTSGNLPPYRFVYLVDKAKQHAATVQSFGAQLLSAFEKGDAEELGHLRAVHDHNLLELRTKVTQLEIDAAEDAIEGLRRQKAAVEDRRQHFTSLREVGLSACERKQQDLHGQAANFRNAAGIAQVVASILTVIPDMGAWTAMKFGGSQLGASARAVAEGLNAVAGHYEVGSVRAGSEASQQRRDQDWQHQVEAARLELAQIDSHITAAEIKRDIAVRSLAIHEQTVAQSEELFEFLREKFSSVDRYRLLSKDLRRLHRQAFNSALALARMAEQAYRAERPGDDSLLAGDYWDAESAGLLAGERLVLDLERLERQFIETNYRELEIEHSFSLAQLAPDALSALQLIGECQFDIPEWFFDLTYPGQYRRRLKAVRITVPCVTGPYANIGATLRLDGSQIRLAAPLTGQPLGPLTAVPPRHTAAIATSRAQNDAGVFDFSFRDERYMPFEGAGAISSWTLQLPRTLRTFDYATINDIIVHLDYTAQYDEGLRQRWDGVAHELTNLLAAPAPAAPLLYRVFSLRGEFPDTFHRLVTSAPGTEVGLALDARHFPGFATGRDRHVEAGTAALRIVTPLRALPATSVSIARTVAAPPQPWRTVAAPAVPDRDGGELCEFDLGDVFATAASSPGVPADAIGPYVMRLATAVDPRDLQDIVLTIGYRLARTRP